MSNENITEELLPEFAKVGQKVPEFTMEAFDPTEGGFVEVDLGALRKEGKWAILFFYPADFTFVCPTELADLAAKHKELTDLARSNLRVHGHQVHPLGLEERRTPAGRREVQDGCRPQRRSVSFL